MGKSARVEAAEMLPCPLCEVGAGQKCLVGKRRIRKQTTPPPDAERGPHPIRVDLARAAKLLVGAAQKPTELVINRRLTQEEQSNVDMLAAGGAVEARKFLDEEDARDLLRARQMAADKARAAWVARVRAGKGLGRGRPPGTQ